jgi:hypothetical protein
VGYVLAFTLVGYGFNADCGLLHAPVLALGLVAFPTAAGDLALAAVGRRARPGADERQRED